MATNNVYEDQDLLRGLFNLRKKPLDGGTTPQDSYKIDLDDLMIILSKKMKDNDKKQDLMTAFGFVTKDDPVRPKTPPRVLTEEEIKEGITLPLEVKKEKGPMAHTEKFYEKLIYAGYRYTEEQADAVIKEADPKNVGFFEYEKFVDNTIKTDKKGKKKGKKKKK